MPWRISSAMSERHEFVLLATQERANVRELCRRFNVSSATAYKWLGRFTTQGVAGLQELPRRPHCSPTRTSAETEAAVVKLRQAHPAWGCRKLRRVLQNRGQQVPSASTITAILRRHQLLDEKESAKHRPFQRFERAAANELWQMDFKGEFRLPHSRCYPLTVLDDHSRFAIVLRALSRNTRQLTQKALIDAFRRYGLPQWITCDNGSPWGSSCRGHYTRLGVWLLRLGIGVSHSRPHHPQTQGKDERFHRTLQAELLNYAQGTTLSQWQQQFDNWREIYNTQRPHEALNLEVPASRYQPSPRIYPERLPAIEYGPQDIVRKVRHFGHIKFRGKDLHVGSAFYGLHVALRQTTTDGLFDVFFCQQQIGRLDLTTE